MTGGRRSGMGTTAIRLVWPILMAFLPGCALIERVTHDPWLSFVFKVINFGILMVILIRFLKKPLGNFLRNRQLKIKQALEDARKAKAQAEQKMQEYEKRLANIDTEIERIHRTLKEEGEKEKAKIIQEAEQMAARIRQKAQATAQKEIRVAQRILREEIADLAVRLAEEMLKRGMTKADQKKLVEEYVDRMETLR